MAGQFVGLTVYAVFVLFYFIQFVLEGYYKWVLRYSV